MPQLGLFSVSIANPISDLPFVEHQVKLEQTTSECYIESKSGDKFKILMRLNAPSSFADTYSARIFVDGKYVSGKILGKLKPFQICTSAYCLGKDIAPQVCAPFMFGETRFSGYPHIRKCEVDSRRGRVVRQSASHRTW